MSSQDPYPGPSRAGPPHVPRQGVRLAPPPMACPPDCSPMGAPPVVTRVRAGAGPADGADARPASPLLLSPRARSAGSLLPMSASLENLGVERRVASALGRGLCFLTILFASGDVWPVIRVGFTFRFAQVGTLLAAVLLLSDRNLRIRGFPGIVWLYGFILWVTLTLPLSLFFERSVGYVLWAITDVLTIVTFVHYFDTESRMHTLIRWYCIGFIGLSWFGLIQLLLGLRGIDLLVQEWWIPGRLPRVSGLSYEPSYYATYLIPGWVFSAFLVETKAALPKPRLVWTCLISTTLALVFSTSRMGWLMMILWILFRGLARTLRALLRGVVGRRSLVGTWSTVLAAVLVGTLLVQYGNQVAASVRGGIFLFQGVGLFGESSSSSTSRLDDFESTWTAFKERPVIGSGIGALPVEIAGQADEEVVSIEEAKAHEGMSVLVELLASTGLIGGFLTLAFAVTVVLSYRHGWSVASPPHRNILSGVAWGVVWILLILQFNQNFLRIYLFVDLAVLVCCIMAVSNGGYTYLPAQGGAGSPRSDDGVEAQTLAGSC
jgi:O-antigen ligase